MKKLLALFLLLSPLSAAQYGSIGPFGGIDTSQNSYIISENSAQDLLNVDIEDSGRSVRKREGSATALTMTVSTSAMHGVYSFYNATLNDVVLAFNDIHITASVNGASPSSIYSQTTVDATWDCVDQQGYAYCANSARDGVFQTDGDTVTELTVNSTGTMVALTPERLVQAGFSEAPNRIDFSASNDFTTWTVGGDPTDPIQFTITSPGSRITHIVYAHERIYWFKERSLGYIMEGDTQDSWIVRSVSNEIGTFDNMSVEDDNGIIYFKGQDGHFYAMDGANVVKISEPLETIVGVSQSRIENSWVETTATDFDDGEIDPLTYLSTTRIDGSISLSTAAASDNFVDTLGTDFAAGTLTNLSTTVTSGSLTLSAFDAPDNSYEDTSLPTGWDLYNSKVGQSFIANSTYQATGFQLYIRRTGSVTGNATFYLSNDSSGDPGVEIATATIAVSGLGLGTFDWETLTFVSPVDLVEGDQYWITNEPIGTSNSNDVDWGYCQTGGACTVDLSTKVVISTITDAVISRTTARTLIYIMTGTQLYEETGNIVSQEFDMGFSTDTWLWEWSSFDVNSTIPSGSITYETQTSSYSGGGYETLVSVTDGNAPTSTVQRYIRYKATITTGDTTETPSIEDVTISMTSRLRPTATYYSPVNSAANITSWSNFDAVSYESTYGLDDYQTHYIRASTNTFTIQSATPSWTAITPGNVPTISTGTFTQVKIAFTAKGDYQANPITDSINLNWFEGEASDQAYGEFFDDRLFFSIAFGQGQSTNNRVPVYNLRNNQWTIYDWEANGFYKRNNSLYFGSASDGTVLKYGGGVYSDNGSAINAYWKSKDLFGVDPYLVKDFRYISLVGDEVENSSITVTYSLDGQSGTSYTVALQNDNKEFIRSNKNLPQGSIGDTMSIRFGNNAANQPFEIFNIKYMYEVKPWRPE